MVQQWELDGEEVHAMLHLVQLQELDVQGGRGVQQPKFVVGRYHERDEGGWFITCQTANHLIYTTIMRPYSGGPHFWRNGRIFDFDIT